MRPTKVVKLFLQNFNSHIYQDVSVNFKLRENGRYWDSSIKLELGK